MTSNVPLAPQKSSPDFHIHQLGQTAYSKDGGGRVVSLSSKRVSEIGVFSAQLNLKEIKPMQRNIPCRNAVIHRLNHSSKGVGIPELNSYSDISIRCASP